MQSYSITGVETYNNRPIFFEGHGFFSLSSAYPLPVVLYCVFGLTDKTDGAMSRLDSGEQGRLVDGNTSSADEHIIGDFFGFFILISDIWYNVERL